ncbi:MAG: HEAT repeat domain-containing protein [Limisphaerales bacterium]
MTEDFWQVALTTDDIHAVAETIPTAAEALRRRVGNDPEATRRDLDRFLRLAWPALTDAVNRAPDIRRRHGFGWDWLGRLACVAAEGDPRWMDVDPGGWKNSQLSPALIGHEAWARAALRWLYSKDRVESTTRVPIAGVAEGDRTPGVHDLVFELLPGPGSGTLFPHPAHAGVLRADADFVAGLERARRLADAASDGPDVRWWVADPVRTRVPAHSRITGSSATGMAALALHHLVRRQHLDPGIVVLADCRDTGDLVRVGAVREKVLALVARAVDSQGGHDVGRLDTLVVCDLEDEDAIKGILHDQVLQEFVSVRVHSHVSELPSVRSQFAASMSAYLSRFEVRDSPVASASRTGASSVQRGDRQEVYCPRRLIQRLDTPVDSTHVGGFPPAAEASFDDVVDRADCCVVVAQAGSGKTTELRRAAARRASSQALSLRERRLPLDQLILPVWLPCAQLTNQDFDIEVAIHSAIRSELQSAGIRVLEPHVRSLARTVARQVYLDSFDEVPPERRIGVRRFIHGFTSNSGRRDTLVLSTRWDALTDLPPHLRQAPNIWELAPLDRVGQEAFARAWFEGDPARAERVLGLLKRHSGSGLDLGVPLVLALLCRACADSGLPDDPTQADLLEHSLQGMFEGQWRNGDPGNPVDPGSLESPRPGVERELLDAETAWERIPSLAWRMFRTLHQRRDFSLREFVDSAPDSAPPSVARALLTRLVHCGLVEPQGGSPGDPSRFVWAHRTFLEYLAARHVAGRADWTNCLEPHLWNESPLGTSGPAGLPGSASGPTRWLRWRAETGDFLGLLGGCMARIDGGAAAVRLVQHLLRQIDRKPAEAPPGCQETFPAMHLLVGGILTSLPRSVADDPRIAADCRKVADSVVRWLVSDWVAHPVDPGRVARFPAAEASWIDLLADGVPEGTRQRAILAIARLRLESAVPHLIPLLHKGTDAWTRRSVVTALGELEAAAAASPLIRMLLAEADKPGLHPPIVRALAQLGSATVLPFLRPVLAVRDSAVRRSALEVIERMRTRPPDVAGIAVLLNETRDESVRQAAVVCLSNSGLHEAADALGNLRRRSSDARTRWLCLRGLLELGAELSGEELGELLRRADEPSQRIAGHTLVAKLGRRAIPVLIDCLRQSGRTSTRRVAMEALGSLGAEDAIPELARHLAFTEPEDSAHSDDLLRESAAAALARIGSDAALRALAAFGGDGRGARARMILVKAAIRQPASRANLLRFVDFSVSGLTEFLREWAQTEGVPPIEELERILGPLEPETVSLALTGLLGSRASSTTRRLALELLGRLGLRDALPSVESALDRAPGEGAALWIALRALTRLDRASAIVRILALLTANRPGAIRRAAIRYLVEIKAVEAVPSLMDWLRSAAGPEDWPEGIRALGLLGAYAAVPWLLDVLGRTGRAEIKAALLPALAQLDASVAIPQVATIAASPAEPAILRLGAIRALQDFARRGWWA